jgi:hypothetical protein
MKASELIETINEIILEHGDIEVMKESLDVVMGSYYFGEAFIDVEQVHTDLYGETKSTMVVSDNTRKIIAIT